MQQQAVSAQLGEAAFQEKSGFKSLPCLSLRLASDTNPRPVNVSEALAQTQER